MANALDALAKKDKPAAKKTTKVAAQTTPEIQKVVDDFITAKAKYDDAGDVLKKLKTTIGNHVKPQYQKLGRTGQFTKTLTLDGTTQIVDGKPVTGSLDVSFKDSFSIPQDEPTLAEIKKVIGKRYDEFLGTVRVASLDPDVLKNDELVNKIVETLAAAGITDVFSVTDRVVAKEGLDKGINELDEAKLAVLLTLIKQDAPSIS